MKDNKSRIRIFDDFDQLRGNATRDFEQAALRYCRDKFGNRSCSEGMYDAVLIQMGNALGKEYAYNQAIAIVGKHLK